MPVLINRNFCDEYPRCEAAKACPTRAIFYDSAEEKVAVNNAKCIDCKKCIEACPNVAVIFARNMGELRGIEKKIGKAQLSKEEHLEKIYGVKVASPREEGKNLAHLEESQLRGFIAKSKFSVVDFWGEGCAPCMLLAHPFRVLARKYSGKIKFGKVDTTKCRRAAKQYGIAAIPTLVFFRKGKEIDRMEGAMTKEALNVWVEMNLKRCR